MVCLVSVIYLDRVDSSECSHVPHTSTLYLPIVLIFHPSVPSTRLTSTRVRLFFRVSTTYIVKHAFQKQLRSQDRKKDDHGASSETSCNTLSFKCYQLTPFRIRGSNTVPVRLSVVLTLIILAVTPTTSPDSASGCTLGDLVASKIASSLP